MDQQTLLNTEVTLSACKVVTDDSSFSESDEFTYSFSECNIKPIQFEFCIEIDVNHKSKMSKDDVSTLSDSTACESSSSDPLDFRLNERNICPFTGQCIDDSINPFSNILEDGITESESAILVSSEDFLGIFEHNEYSEKKRNHDIISEDRKRIRIS